MHVSQRFRECVSTTDGEQQNIDVKIVCICVEVACSFSRVFEIDPFSSLFSIWIV